MTAEAVETPDLEDLWTETPAPPEPEIPITEEPPAPPAPRHARADSATESATDEPAKPRGRRGRPPKVAKEDTKTVVKPASVRAPDFSEWHQYIGNFAIKWAARGYIAFVFRGLDRYEILSEADNAALELDEQQLSDIAKPIAHMADRSKLGKKYGRVIIDSSDGVAAMIQLSMWGSRVNRMAKRYRAKMGTPDNGQAQRDGQGGSGIPEEPVTAQPEPGINRDYTPVNGFGFN